MSEWERLREAACWDGISVASRLLAGEGGVYFNTCCVANPARLWLATKNYSLVQAGANSACKWVGSARLRF